MSVDKSPAKIAGMFDGIAGRYDLLNTVLSGGLDRYWRRRAILALELTGRERLLDVCTGTADVAMAGARAKAGAARVVGVDFAAAMLAHGVTKVREQGLDARIQLVRGDAMRLPVADGSVDAVTIAFGIRNVQQPEVACAELLRVLKPGGRLAILEFGCQSCRSAPLPLSTSHAARTAGRCRGIPWPTITCRSRWAASRGAMPSTASSPPPDFQVRHGRSAWASSITREEAQWASSL
jgi:ubiquinone/menaquinone biosynthesis methyltransferase